jgi:nicotinamidase/pyrazinamidase
LHERGVDPVTVAGFATDVCVRSTALDALEHGHRVEVVADAAI